MTVTEDTAIGPGARALRLARTRTSACSQSKPECNPALELDIRVKLICEVDGSTSHGNKVVRMTLAIVCHCRQDDHDGAC
jgi:hypothetical protein